MPLYEFKCDRCEKVTEFTLKFSDPHPQTCPQCNKGNLNKILSQTSFQLKGGGWYAQGYSSSSAKDSQSSTTSSSSDSGSSTTDSAKKTD
jgi:putative FmdB family regulatory protein